MQTDHQHHNHYAGPHAAPFKALHSARSASSEEHCWLIVDRAGHVILHHLTQYAAEQYAERLNRRAATDLMMED